MSSLPARDPARRHRKSEFSPPWLPLPQLPCCPPRGAHPPPCLWAELCLPGRFRFFPAQRAAAASGSAPPPGRDTCFHPFISQLRVTHRPSSGPTYLCCVHHSGLSSGPPSPVGAPFARETVPSALPCSPWVVSLAHGRCSVKSSGSRCCRTSGPQAREDLCSRQGAAHLQAGAETT